jgi:hypothetical protein
LAFNVFQIHMNFHKDYVLCNEVKNNKSWQRMNILLVL